MIFVKKLNVVKSIDESRAAEYAGLGFEPVEDKHPEADKSERIKCPHCEKDYATESSLAAHIKDKHPEAE